MSFYVNIRSALTQKKPVVVLVLKKEHKIYWYRYYLKLIDKELIKSTSEKTYTITLINKNTITVKALDDNKNTSRSRHSHSFI